MHVPKQLLCHLQTHVEACSVAGIWLVTVTQTSALFLTSVAWKSFRHSQYLSQQQHENFFYRQLSLMVFTASESAKDLARSPQFHFVPSVKAVLNRRSSCSSQGWNTRAAEPPARQGEVEARPWPRSASTGGSATPLTSSKKSNLNHRAAELWQMTQVCCHPGGLQVAL